MKRAKALFGMNVLSGRKVLFEKTEQESVRFFLLVIYLRLGVNSAIRLFYREKLCPQNFCKNVR